MGGGGPCEPLWEEYRESRRCSRDTYPESYITKYASIRRQRGGRDPVRATVRGRARLTRKKAFSSQAWQLRTKRPVNSQGHEVVSQGHEVVNRTLMTKTND